MGGTRISFAILGLCAATSTARAGHICELAEEGVLEVDASLDEWRDFAPLSRGRGDADASFEMRCGYDKHRLYVAVRIKDERIIRTSKGESGSDDNLVVSLRAGGDASRSLRVFPGTRGYKPKRVGAGGKIKVDDTLLEDGWALEASVPLSAIPGWGPSTPLLHGEVTYRDVDKAGAGPEARLPFIGSMHFSADVPALRGFLAAAKLTVKELRLDTLADVDGLAGTERVVAGGRFLGVLSDEFAFIELPVESPGDVLDVKLVDFDGDGRDSIVAHFRQNGGGGSREVVTVWNLNAGNQLAMSFGFEVAVELGERRLVNLWSLVPAGERRAPDKGKRPKKGKRVPGQDLVVEVSPQDNQGWSAKSFAQVVPSTDVRPILTPWGNGRRAVVYYFDGETAMEAGALPALK
ncbi:MAG TPA: hypothetical protein VIG06_05225 [Kofleriaceae bacterium]|jgi:hypothetical protein